jgi:hypothetical protein
VLSSDLYDIDGRVVQSSIFGNGEQRTTYRWTGDTYTADVAFYDSNGKVMPELSKSFRPLTNEVSQLGLCPLYTSRQEKDEASKIERIVETCSDRSIRRTTTREMAVNGDLLRETVEDAMGRSWIHETTFGLNFKIVGFKQTVNDLVRPKYWQEVTSTSEQSVENGNEISYMASSIDSRNPGLRYQYLEERKITYYR